MRYRNALLFVVLSVVWGSAFVAIKAGLADIPPVLFAAIRYDVAGALVLGYAVLTVERWRPRTRHEWAAVAVGSVFLIAGYHALLFVGEQGTTSAAAAVVVSLSPVLTTGFARLLLPEERLIGVGIAGLLLGLVGVAVLVRPDPANLFGRDVVSVGLVFGAALSFAFGSVLLRWLDAGLPIETLEAWSMVGGAILMHVLSVALLGESPAAIDWTPRAIVALGYLSLIASAVGFLVYFDLLDRLGPVEINLVSYLAPVVAAVVGFAFLGEVIDAATGVGFLFIFVGFVLLKRRALARELDRWREAAPL
ncbi:Permease of the drug/metabolite transporter (DMT) superfamily [Halapricum desulfuricans]|uniref:Permease of the drug/metabolite transporter (DMT) superfamily n=1 Tax=Halapricum desulfuricans TaxID=2841257 RepID=A0A897NJS2_9EURY|nr:EamA family transporter [Halapricum desulfuricans]QSG11109.1 Permease of the drug/metabolite transporter (DMT) superfamily [Halapricum desulfuricans]